MTSRIYYTDPYCRRFAATVVKAFEHEGRPAVVLDRTAFYPSSGGQPFDRGQLGSQTVVEVIDDGAEVIHIVSAPMIAGTTVDGEIDWERRFDHMQQHTGQHLLSAAFERLFANRTVGFHMGSDVSTIDVAREASVDQLEDAERAANRVVWDNRDVSIRFVDPSRQPPAGAPLGLRKESAREGVLRLIEVAEFDLSACGGTHVTRTGAIGVIAVAGSERFKGGSRITFACGGRGLRLLAMLRESTAGSVRALSVLPRDVPAAIERLQNEGKDLRRMVRRFQDAAARHESLRLSNEAVVVNGVRLVIQALDGWDVNGLKTIAVGVTSSVPSVVALLSLSSPHDLVVARSPDVSLNSEEVLKGLAATFGGRGGGRPELAQGGNFAGEHSLILAEAARLISVSL